MSFVTGEPSSKIQLQNNILWHDNFNTIRWAGTARWTSDPYLVNSLQILQGELSSIEDMSMEAEEYLLSRAVTGQWQCSDQENVKIC
jgi:hypothetical protein